MGPGLLPSPPQPPPWSQPVFAQAVSSPWALAQFPRSRHTVRGWGRGGEALGLPCPPRRAPPGISQGESESLKPLPQAYVTYAQPGPPRSSQAQTACELYPFNAHTQAPSRAAPQVGVDGVARGQRLHEAHARVLDGERHVLRGAGKGRAEKLSAQPAKATVCPRPRPRCSHRFSTTTTAEPSGRVSATASRPFFWLASSPTLWEPSGMNLLRGEQAWSGGAHSPLLRSHSSPAHPQSQGRSRALTAHPAPFPPGVAARDMGPPSTHLKWPR